MPAIVLTPAERKEYDRLYREISAHIAAALKRGWPPSRISFTLASDIATVNKIKNKHPFRLSTLRLLHARLHLIDSDPPLTLRQLARQQQEFLTS